MSLDVRAKYSSGTEFGGTVVNNDMMQANNPSIGLATREKLRPEPRMQLVFARRILLSHTWLHREPQLLSQVPRSRASAFEERGIRLVCTADHDHS